jgi:hypothetical protein
MAQSIKKFMQMDGREVWINLNLVRTMTTHKQGDRPHTNISFDKDHSRNVIETPEQILE